MDTYQQPRSDYRQYLCVFSEHSCYRTKRHTQNDCQGNASNQSSLVKSYDMLLISMKPGEETV